MAESTRDGRTEVPVPVAQPGRGTTNDPLSVSWDQLAVSSRVSSEVRDGLIEDLRRALAVEPEAGESGAVQWYVSDLAVDCDTEPLLRVLARGLLAAGWRPPLPEPACEPFDPDDESSAALVAAYLAHFLGGRPARMAAHVARGLDVLGLLKPSPLPDSETQWGTRDRHGRVHSVGVENETQARSMRSMTPVRREVGPWIEVPRG